MLWNVGEPKAVHQHLLLFFFLLTAQRGRWHRPLQLSAEATLMVPGRGGVPPSRSALRVETQWRVLLSFRICTDVILFDCVRTLTSNLTLASQVSNSARSISLNIVLHCSLSKNVTLCLSDYIVYNLNPFSTMSSYKCLRASQKTFLLWIPTLLGFPLSKGPFADCFHVDKLCCHAYSTMLIFSFFCASLFFPYLNPWTSGLSRFHLKSCSHEMLPIMC